MAPALPDDVVVLILEELAHPAHTPDSYHARQKTPRSVCLASRKLYRLAQPYLWRHVAVRSRRELDLVKSSRRTRRLGRCTRSYTVVESPSVKPEDAVAVSALFPSVVDLRVKSCRLFPERLRSLGPFAHLRRLDLSMAGLPVGSCATLPALEELCIRYTSWAVEDAQEQLQPARLPRLRELLYAGVTDDTRTWNHLPLARVLSPGLLRQLDLIQTDSTTVDPDNALANGLDTPVLVIGPDRSHRHHLPPPRHMITGPLSFNEQHNTTAETLVTFAISIAHLPSPPRTPHAADPPHLLLLPLKGRTFAAAHRSLARHLGALEAVCAEKGVRLEWTEDPPEGELISPAFRRYARELREARALER